jgi:hypothetical protein
MSKESFAPIKKRYTIAPMAQTKPIPVRLDEALIERLKKSSARMGSNNSALIKFLVKTFLDHFESRGIASLPPNWQEIMRLQDGRTFGQQMPALRVAETPESIPLPPPKPTNYRTKKKKGPKS